MMQAIEQAPVFELSGGRLCLDFTNTMGDSRAHPNEKLLSYGHLVAWGQQAGILTEPAARQLMKDGFRRPEDADNALRHAIELRETLYRIFSAIIDKGTPQHADLEVLNGALSRAMAHLRVSQPAAGFAWEWAPDPEALDRMLWPVIQSAADVLHSGEIARVGHCGGRDCDWLFLDTSRNHSRRWCDMRSCGNRAKARRYYERKKADR